MDTRRSKLPLVAPLLLATSVAQAADPVVHKVAPHDTLSQVVQKILGGPVYGKHGFLARVLKLNPKLGDGNVIRPGQRIILSEDGKVAAEMMPTPRLPAAAEKAQEVAECREPEAKEEDDGTASHLGLDVGAEYFRIDAVDIKTGGTATILSQMSPGLRAHWELDWTPEWTSRLGFSYRSVKALDTDDNGKSVQNRDGKLMGFSGAVERRWNERSVSQAFLQRQEELFTRSPNTSTVMLDRLGVLSAGLGHEQTIFRKGRASAGVAAQAAFLFAGSGPGYTTNSGVQGRGSVFMEHNRQALALRGEAFYDVRKQNSSISEINQKTVGFYLGARWLLK